MKRKIGTLIDDDLYRDVKHLAMREHLRIDDVVQHAVSDYVQRSKSRPGRVGLARLLETDPLALTSRQFRASMEADFFEQ